MMLTNKWRGPEIIHLYDIEVDTYICSKGNHFWGTISGEEFSFKLPTKNIKTKLIMPFRLLRRLLRYDKSNAVYCSSVNSIYVLYRGQVFTYSIPSRELRQVHKLRQSRNTLHMGICVHDGYIYIGEYGDSSNLGVPLWRGKEDIWELAFHFPPGSIKHIHGVYYDKYENAIWVTTGDFEGQCYLLKTKDNFETVEFIGDGSQKYRTVNLLFTETKVFWAMDSHIEQNYCYYIDRTTNELNVIENKLLQGPVWYMKNLIDGYLIQTTVEKGSGVTTNKSRVYFSKDLLTWTEVYSVGKDIFPYPLMKNGVIAFADGVQSSKDFVLFGEGLKRLDGVVFKASLGEDVE